MRFKILAGSHIQDGKVYPVNSIVHSDHDLTKTYRNKFRNLDEVVDFEPNEQTAVQPFHQQQSHPLGVAPSAPAGLETVKGGTGEEEDPGDQGQADGAPSTPKGKNVTKQFPDAAEQDYLVYKKQGVFFVYDKDDLAEPVNVEGVQKEGVAKVIKDDLA